MVLVVVPPKRVDLLLGILQGCEPMDVETFLPEPSVERLDRGIVRWLAAATKVQHDAMSVRPQIHRGADKLGPVVAVDALGRAPLEPQAPKGRNDVPSSQPMAHVDRQALARE